jgi:hypothetical protein
VTVLAWVLAALAVYRLTLLVVADEITAPPRDWLLARLNPEGRAAFLLSCAWCAACWIAPPVVGSGLAWSDGWGWQLAAGSFAFSGVAGFLASYASPD